MNTKINNANQHGGVSRTEPAVEIPTLKSLFIEMYFGETLLSSGTAFLIAKDQESHCTLVTNRHNVTGRNQETSQCLSKAGAIPDHVVIHFHKNGEEIGEWLPIRLPLYKADMSPLWIEHPNLKEKADVVALNLKWGSDIKKFPYYLDTEHDRPGIVVSPAEPVSVVGFPFGLYSAGKFPIWATGFLAPELSHVTPENPVFLIDCRTRQGQSGSAVIAYRSSGARKMKDGRIVSTLSPNKEWEFLGIYSGRINSESDLGRVWHVSLLKDLLLAAEDAMKKNSLATDVNNPSNAELVRPGGLPSMTAKFQC